MSPESSFTLRLTRLDSEPVPAGLRSAMEPTEFPGLGESLLGSQLLNLARAATAVHLARRTVEGHRWVAGADHLGTEA